MKVLHLMRTYGAHGGEQQLSQYFAAEPRGDVDEVFVFVYRDEICANLFEARIPTLRTLSLEDVVHATGTAWQEFALLLPRLLRLQWQFIRVLRREKPAVCVAQGFQAALIAWPAALIFRATKWVYMHRVTKAGTKASWVFRALYWPFNAVAGNSASVTQSLGSLTQARKLITLDNGIDLGLFDRRAVADPQARLPCKTGKIIVSVGRLLPQKGQSMLLEAFFLVAERYKDVSLLIVGDGPAREKLQNKIIDSEFADRVFFLGYRNDVPAILARSSVFANASRWEGMSNAVLEGMAARLPSVVVDAPGVSECHQAGITGFVVSASVDELAEAILNLLVHPMLALEMGEAARKHLEAHYSMEVNRRRFLNLFSRLAQD
jgi:glycosyltransferase involved in cell wall biosynthesis